MSLCSLPIRASLFVAMHVTGSAPWTECKPEYSHRGGCHVGKGGESAGGTCLRIIIANIQLWMDCVEAVRPPFLSQRRSTCFAGEWRGLMTELTQQDWSHEGVALLESTLHFS